jgi:uncharacterized C2H2 Zn-finger protein
MPDKPEITWLACPYCHLSFSDATEYEIHAEKEHKGRKKKLPTRIAQRGS